MDRFIDKSLKGCEKMKEGLKSNMDRFIVRLEESIIRSRRSLKSNMDRFIVLRSYNYEMFSYV